MKGLNKELHLRQRIAELQHYRENGIRSLEEAEAYDQIRKQKELNLILTKRSGLKTIAPAQQTSSVLSQMEKRLCTTLDLKHDDFNRIKSHILSSLPSSKSSNSGSETRKQVSKMYNIEIKKVDRLFEFFVKNV